MSTQENITRTREIVNQIKLPDSFDIRVDLHPEGRTFLQIRQCTTCNRTGEPYNEGGRKWDISGFATESEIVFTVWKAFLTFVEHEMRENFTYKGKKIFDPHIDVNALLVACEQLQVRT